MYRAIWSIVVTQYLENSSSLLRIVGFQTVCKLQKLVVRWTVQNFVMMTLLQVV